MRSSLLYVTPYLPSLPNGSSYYTRRILEKLAPQFEISCFTLVFRGEEKATVEFARFCERLNIRVEFIPHAPPEAPPEITTPLSMHALTNENLIKAVSSISRKKHFKVAHLEHIELAYLAPHLKAAIKSLTVHELGSIREISFVPYRRGAERRSHLGQHARWKLAELTALARFDKAFVFNQAEAKALSQLYLLGTQVELLPVAAEEIAPYSRDKKYDLLFLGNYSHEPNRDSLRFITERMLKELAKSERPPIFAVAGANMPEEVKNSARKYPFFKPLGFVKDHIELIKEARLFVAPIITGGGIRIKILTALSAGVPTLTTERGSWGVPIEGDGGLIVAPPIPSEFAKIALETLGNKERLEALSDSALAIAARQRAAFEAFELY